MDENGTSLPEPQRRRLLESRLGGPRIARNNAANHAVEIDSRAPSDPDTWHASRVTVTARRIRVLPRRSIVAAGCLAISVGSIPGTQAAALPTVAKVKKSSVRINYGNEPSQFGFLSVPDSPRLKIAVVVLIHGGFWLSSYGAELMSPLASDLVARGYAAWNIEYRRVGERGGGYPGTLTDVAAAIDKLGSIAADNRLDVGSIVVVGHSAGGQLALWAAGRSKLKAGDPGSGPKVTPKAAIGLAPVFNLRSADRASLGQDAVGDFLGGHSVKYLDRYRVATPTTDTKVALTVIRAVDDTVVPKEFATPQTPRSTRIIDVPGDHFTLIDPLSDAWARTVEVIDGALR